MPGPKILPASEQLQAVLEKYDVSVHEDHVAPLARYCKLLWKWNRKINLTRHTDFEQFVTRDLIDSLRLSQHIPSEQTVLDVGSGGGVPGIILGITRPDLKVSLAESVGKKARVLKAIARQMKLGVPVCSDRAEAVLKTQSFDVLTIRAVASLRKLLFWFQQHSDAFGRMLLIKGPRWTAERDEAAEEGLLENVLLEVADEYPTPGHDNNSVILSVRYEKLAAE